MARHFIWKVLFAKTMFLCDGQTLIIYSLRHCLIRGISKCYKPLNSDKWSLNNMLLGSDK